MNGERSISKERRAVLREEKDGVKCLRGAKSDAARNESKKKNEKNERIGQNSKTKRKRQTEREEERRKWGEEKLRKDQRGGRLDG